LLPALQANEGQRDGKNSETEVDGRKHRKYNQSRENQNLEKDERLSGVHRTALGRKDQW